MTTDANRARKDATGRSRFVRQFALTQGRVRSRGADLPLDTQVVATANGVGAAKTGSLPVEQAHIVHRCRSSALAIAELAAHLRIHLGVARVIVSDMADAGLVAVSISDVGPDGPDLSTLERLLDDLQAL